MATRRQRARKHEQRRHHGAVAQRALQEALDSRPTVGSLKAMTRHMEERGFVQDFTTGKWRKAAR